MGNVHNSNWFLFFLFCQGAEVNESALNEEKFGNGDTALTKTASVTLGITSAGAIEKSIGLVAASAYDTMRATGFTPKSSAPFNEDSNTAAAPSFNDDALPAVTVPFSAKFITTVNTRNSRRHQIH